MTSLLTIFTILQMSLLFIMALHDWVEIQPFTDINALKKHHTMSDRLLGSFINSVMVAIPLALTVWYQPFLPHAAAWCISIMYGILTIGTLCVWWVPYVFGSSYEQKQGFAEYRNTHAFLPARSDNVIPNTVHCILHVHVWLCFFIGLYLLVQ